MTAKAHQASSPMFPDGTGIAPALHRDCTSAAPGLHRDCTSAAPERYRRAIGGGLSWPGNPWIRTAKGEHRAIQYSVPKSLAAKALAASEKEHQSRKVNGVDEMISGASFNPHPIFFGKLEHENLSRSAFYLL